MGVNQTTIHSWIKKNEIPFVRPNRFYLIVEVKFWKWLKSNLEKVNYKNVNDSIEMIAPTWYKNEIKKAKQNYSKLNEGAHPWTNFEETLAWSLYLKGHTNKQIALELDRKELSVKQKMLKLKKKKMKKAS